MGSDWFIESGITSAEQLELTAAPNALQLQQREVDDFKALTQKSPAN
ncbi:hypothetical protein [Pantoea agglomerans]